MLFSYLLPRNIYCWYLFKLSQWGNSSKYPHVFLGALNTILLNFSNHLTPFELKICSIQLVVIMNFISNDRIKMADCIWRLKSGTWTCTHILGPYNAQETGPEVIKLFSCSTQLWMKFVLPIKKITTNNLNFLPAK